MQILASFLGESKSRAYIALATLAVVNALIFSAVGSAGKTAEEAAVSFLDVGQGDASLIELGSGTQILIDGGPANGRLVSVLGEMMSPYDRTIELVVLTHPEVDHYGGLMELFQRYEVGAFIDAGVTKDLEVYDALMDELSAREIRRITLRAGDVIRYSTGTFTVLSPGEELIHAKETNDTSMVMEFQARGARFLFTGDIGGDVERVISKALAEPVDVLKVSHHGSKFSSTAEFLEAARPLLAAIGVGRNSYGHPTREALARLEAAGARVYRTDRNGTITVRIENGALRVFVER